MATIGTEPNGRRRVLFVAADGRRRTVRLGKCSQRDAEQICRHIEELASVAVHRQPVARSTALWLADIGAPLHQRLARAGLVEPRRAPDQVGLAAFVDAYVASRKDLKPGTLTLLRQSRAWLLRFLGEDRRLDRVSPADADAYRAHMVEAGLAKASIAKRLRYARHFFDVATRRELIESNPFEHIKGIVIAGDPRRRAFVPAETVRRVMDQTDDPQWKLLIALARWGGLRIPSEALALTWSDVDFDNGRFVVRSPKTEHHADAGVRVVPMFPELAGLLKAVFDQAESGSLHVITRYRNSSVNLRTHLLRLIARAGLKPWPKLWQNLRASRATELADAFPSHVCAAWLGHTERIADAFYRQVTDEHMARAIQTPPSTAQDPAQQEHAAGRTAHSAASATPTESLFLSEKRGSAITCEAQTLVGLGDTGLEPVTPSL